MHADHEYAAQSADQRRAARMSSLRFWLILAAAVLAALAVLWWPAVADIESWVVFK